MTDDAKFEELCQAAGVNSSYRTPFGGDAQVSRQTLEAVLAALDLPAASERQIEESLAAVRQSRTAWLPPSVVARSEEPTGIGLRAPPSETITWRLTDEAGETSEGRATASNGSVLFPALGPGYYRLEASSGRAQASTIIIAAPSGCWLPACLLAGGRRWGVTAQAYGLRSQSNFGIGDFSDIARAAAGSAACGSAFFGLSPLHALFPADRTKYAPYSPSSRLFLDPDYIDPKVVPLYQGSRAQKLLEEGPFAAQGAALRGGSLVDYAGAWTLKSQILEALWRERQEQHAAQLAEYRREAGEALEDHATFDALHEHLKRRDGLEPWQWPAAYRDRSSAALRQFREAQGERISYFAWLQGLAQTQLAAAAGAARAAGMEIGLYCDLAVGADRWGSECWSNPQNFVLGLSEGAPPDPFNDKGQNWGFPPLHPLQLIASGFAQFRALVRSSMARAHAIRFDHAFQLQRLFVFPEGSPEGTYVDYPFEALLAILRLESHRNRCMVVAEDLGAAPDGFSDRIMASGLLSSRLLWFEREESDGDGGGGTFNAPRRYPRSAVASITTHDLPSFAGWWHGTDLDTREAIGLLSPEEAARERSHRGADRDMLSHALKQEGLAPRIVEVVRFLGRAPSALLALSLEDVTEERNQPNMPGPDCGYPNWRRKLPLTLDQLFAPSGTLSRIGAVLAEEGRGARQARFALAAPPPRATYRLQFNKDFTFSAALAILPYLKKLGISHIYASPILEARAGSAHGYDIVNHGRVNPELGGEEGFAALTEALRNEGMGLILDIVPNHMAVGGGDNPWWLSVLEWGRDSPHAAAFDIDWERRADRKLVLPFLSDDYGITLESGGLVLHCNERAGFEIRHHGHVFPVSPLTYPIILDIAAATLEADPRTALRAIADELRDTRDRIAAPSISARLGALMTSDHAAAGAIARAMAFINGTPGSPASFGTLHRLLEAQTYHLAGWRAAASEINYRRFFDINSLCGLRVEEADVFEATHALIFRLIREGRVQGLRIDHIDGLAEPPVYLKALQDRVGPGFYVVVEKILGEGEAFRHWPAVGTTGYEILNEIDGLFVDTSQADAFERIYRNFSGLEGSYDALLEAAKRETLLQTFASELSALTSDLKKIANADRLTRDCTAVRLREALSDLIVALPVYRSYLDGAKPSAEDFALLRNAVARAKKRTAPADPAVHDFIVETLASSGPESRELLIARVRKRFQQLTGPVVAKSLEDTLFFRYLRLISLNEVGGAPSRFGTDIEKFHAMMTLRAEDTPHALNASATHDTKRGEDARGRLNALSEMPEAWSAALEQFKRIAEPLLTSRAPPQPDANDQYMLLQSILGSWQPALLVDEPSPGEILDFQERLEKFFLKALKEAKRHTSWVQPRADYEKAALTLIARLLQPASGFHAAFLPLARRLDALGRLSGLSRTILKCTLPGIPDFYQGTELWDYSFVDPDNRRPVDYPLRAALIRQEGPLGMARMDEETAPEKLSVIAALLADRAATPALYAEGTYEPISVSGGQSSHLVAFLRRTGNEALAVAVPRLAAALWREPDAIGDPAVWEETSLRLPRGRWRDLFVGEGHVVDGGPIYAKDLLGGRPFSVLRRVEQRR